MSSDISFGAPATGLGALPPIGSSILRFTLEWFFKPTILTKFLIDLAVEPSLPIIWPISAGFTVNESNTPISSTLRSTLTSFGLSTNSLTINSRKSLSGSVAIILSVM